MAINSAFYPFVGLNCETYLLDSSFLCLTHSYHFFILTLSKSEYLPKIEREDVKPVDIEGETMKRIENEERKEK